MRNSEVPEAPAQGRAAVAPGVPAVLGLTRDGVIGLASVVLFAVIGLAQGQLLFFFLCCLVLGAAVACRVLARRNLAGIEVERRLPHRSRVGLPTPLRYELSASGGRSAVGLEVEDQTARGVKPLRLEIEVPVVGPGEPARCTTHVGFQRRGLFVMDTVRLTSRYPLGIFGASTRLRAPARVLVHPAEGRATARLRDRLLGRSRDQVAPTALWRGNDLLYGVREYREGDDPRRIHWRTTARRGVLTVTQWRAEEESEVLLVLGRGIGAGAGSKELFERAVSVTATIWRLAVRERLSARLLLDRPEDVIDADGRTALILGLDALARVPSQEKRDPLGGLRALTSTHRPRTVVYVGTGEEPGIAAKLDAAAGRRGHFVHVRVDRSSLRQWVGGIA